MFHFDCGPMSEHEGSHLPGIPSFPTFTNYTAADYDVRQQKTFEEIYLKVMVVRKFVVCTVLPSGTKTAESPFYLEETSPVTMKIGEREIQHIPAPSNQDTPSCRKSEMKINSNLCEIIPLTESIGLKVYSTFTSQTSSNIASELVSLVQNPYVNATHASVPSYGKPEEKSDINSILLMESKKSSGKIPDSTMASHNAMASSDNTMTSSDNSTASSDNTTASSDNTMASSYITMASSDNTMVSSEIVPPVLNDSLNATQVGETSVQCYGKPEERSETNPIDLLEGMETVSQVIVDNSITSVDSNSNKQSITSEQHFHSTDLSLVSAVTRKEPEESSRNEVISTTEWCLDADGQNNINMDGPTGTKISKSCCSRNEMISSQWTLHDENNINRNGPPGMKISKSYSKDEMASSSGWSVRDENNINKEGPTCKKILELSISENESDTSEWPLDDDNDINKDKRIVPESNDLEETDLDTQDISDDEQGDGKMNEVKPSSFKYTVESDSITNSFEMENVATSVVSRKLRSATNKYKICKQSINDVSEQLQSSDHKCLICGEVFQSETLLKNHNLVHEEADTSRDSYHCFCGQMFFSYTCFMEHGQNCEILKRCNMKDQNVTLFCSKCENEFKSVHLFKNHHCSHHNKKSKYVCRLCSSSFKTRNGLARHRQKMCCPFICSICDINCKDEDSLKIHLRIHTNLSKEQIYKCENCSQKFFSLVGFQKHQRHRCTLRRSCQNDDPWICPKCKNSYTSQSSIYRHKVKGCLGEKIYKCDICKKSFHTLEAVQEHVGIHKNMNEQGRYYCSACNKSYSQRSGYLKHKRKGLCDTNSVFHCSYCPKVFMNESRRNWHQRMHSASENHQTHVCLKCGKEYFSSRALHKHIQRNTCKELATFAERKKDQKFVCEECGKVYGSTSALFKHKQNHRGYRPYSCKFCNKSFCRPFILTQHIKIHTGDRQWLCSQCGKSFYTKSHLKRHQISHDKTQDNVCDICNKRYAYKHDLRKHMKISHSNVVKDGVNLFANYKVEDEVITSTLNIQNELLTPNNYM